MPVLAVPFFDINKTVDNWRALAAAGRAMYCPHFPILLNNGSGAAYFAVFAEKMFLNLETHLPDSINREMLTIEPLYKNKNITSL